MSQPKKELIINDVTFIWMPEGEAHRRPHWKVTGDMVTRIFPPEGMYEVWYVIVEFETPDGPSSRDYECKSEVEAHERAMEFAKASRRVFV